MKITKYQLKNGLKVLLVPSHKSPVISTQMWVRTGSADEKKGEEGISHFIEHLVFKGTRSFKVGEIASTIEGAGGELNAYTSFDQTVFYVTISKAFSEVALKAISEMMGHPTFDPVEIDNEREVVVEEIKRGLDSLGRKASQNLFSTTYKKHPYGIPVIGYEKNIRKWSAKKIKSYFQARYVPRNMFLLVTGDFTIPEMKKAVEKYFSQAVDFKVDKRKRPKEPKATKPKISVQKSEFKQSILYLGWRVPSVLHKDTPALDVLAMLLGQGDSSRLVKKMRIDKPLVNSTGSSVFSPQDEGLFLVSAGYNKDNLTEILKETAQVLLDFFKTGISQEEFSRIIRSIESEQFYSLETVDGMSRTFGNSEFLTGTPNYLKTYLKQVQNLKPEDLRRVAIKYLNPKSIIAAVTTDADEKSVKKNLGIWVKEFTKQFDISVKQKAKPVKVKKSKSWSLKIGSQTSKIETIKNKNGDELILRYSNETPSISVRMALLGGSRIENESHAGLTELMSRALLSATENYSEEELLAKVEGLAASLGPVSGKNSFGISSEFLKPVEGEMAEMFEEVIQRPLFPQEVIDRERTIQLEQIKNRQDNPGAICSKIFAKAIFGDHPYGREQIGEPQTISNLTRQDILDQWHANLSAPKMTMTVCGQFDEKLWKKVFQHLSDFRFKNLKKSSSAPKLEMKDLNKDIFLYESSKKEQSHMIYGFPGLTLFDDERYVLEVMQSVLAGQGGRLFLELRDKASLAYTVSPMKMEGLERGFFGAYIGCSPDKVKQARDMMLVEFQKLVTEPVPALELERAKNYLIGRHDIELQKTSTLCAAFTYDGLYGIPVDETFQYPEKIQAVTSDKIQKLAKKIFGQNHVISLVGPTNPFAA